MRMLLGTSRAPPASLGGGLVVLGVAGLYQTRSVLDLQALQVAIPGFTQQNA